MKTVNVSNSMPSSHILVHNHHTLYILSAPNEDSALNFVVKHIKLKLRHLLLFSENLVILASGVLAQYTRVAKRQTTHYDNKRTLTWNCYVQL